MNDRDEPLVVLDELSSGVWRATLNSPRDRNALSADMRREILDALSRRPRRRRQSGHRARR